jgi:hypothetical protein
MQHSSNTRVKLVAEEVPKCFERHLDIGFIGEVELVYYKVN